MKAISAFLCLAALLSLFACGGGSSSTDAPTVVTIPLQTRASGFDVSVDLADYVNDSNYPDSSLTFAVTSVTGSAFLPVKTASGTVTNYGSFSGTVYSNTFANLGLYTVHFTVTDPDGHASSASFQVKVNLGSMMVFDDDGDLKYLDGGTGRIFYFSRPAGYDEVWQANLADGTIVFTRVIGTQTDLHAYLPTTGRRVTVGADSQKSETYVGATSDSQILYAKEDTDGNHLHLFDPAAERSWTVSGGPVESLGDIEVGTNDEIYYRRPVDGEVCIYHYSIAEGLERFVAETDDTFSEVGIEEALNNGDLVYWKKNGDGYKDYYYYAAGGSSYGISTGNATADATYVDNTSLGHVLYRDGGSTNLQLFDSGSHTSTDLGANSTYDTDMVGGDYVIYTTAADVVTAYRISTGTTVTIATATADYKGKLSDDKTLVYAKSNNLYGCDITSAAAIASPTQYDNGIGNSTFDAVLDNDDVVFTVANRLHVYDSSEATADNVDLADGNETYQGDLGEGKIVLATANGSGNLHIWDGVADAAATVSDNAAADTYLGKGVFARTESTVSTSGTVTTTTRVTRTARVVYFSRGNHFYTVKMVTTATGTEEYDAGTGATTSTFGTPSSSTGSATQARQNVDDVFQVTTDGDEVKKGIVTLTE